MTRHHLAPPESESPRVAPNLPQIDPADGARLRAGLHRTGMGTNEVARLWKVEPRVLRQWLEGKRPVPGAIWRLLELELEKAGRVP